MCECIVQTCEPFSQYTPVQVLRNEPDVADDDPSGRPKQIKGKRERLIKPRMRLRAVVIRNGRPESVDVRWGWVPDWSMGATPPLTQLPLEQVMRANQYARLRREGRALIPVEGWYESARDDVAATRPRLAYVTSRRAGPLFLAALAQVGDGTSGCDGLALVTHDSGDGSARLLALDVFSAQAWLSPGLDWQRAQALLKGVLGADQLEQLFTAKRHFTPGLRRAFATT